MVRQRRSRNTRRYDLEDVNSQLTAENFYLKQKNQDLATRLSKAKEEIQNLKTTNIELHKRGYGIGYERLKRIEFLKSIDTDLTSYLQKNLCLIKQITDMQDKIKKVITYPDLFNCSVFDHLSLPASPSEGNQMKRMTVMPMVSGHTISSPKINLPRVTVKQLTEMMRNNDTVNEEGSDGDMEDENDSLDGHNENVPEQQQLLRLSTLPEEGSENISMESSLQRPLLSGVFTDVKVYVSPVSPQIQLKRKYTSPDNLSKSKANIQHSSNLSKSINLTPTNISESSYNITDSMLVSQNSDIETKSEALNIAQSSSSCTVNVDDPLEENFNLILPVNMSTPISPENTADNTRVVKPETPLSSSTKITRRKHFRKPSRWGNTTPVCSVTLQRLTNEKLSTCVSSDSESKEQEQIMNGDETSQKSNKSDEMESSVNNDTLLESTKDVETRRNRKVSFKNSLQRHMNDEKGKNSEKRTSTGLRESIERKRSDSPTVLEKSSLISTKNTRRERRSSEPTSTSMPGRRRRNVKAISYAEPSLVKKLRRS